MKYPEESYWKKEWERIQGSRGHSTEVGFWNEFAPRFRKKPAPGKVDEYSEQFYNLVGFEKVDTIFDMGCGSGTLSLPFAQKGHKVYGADFSPVMLETMMNDAEEMGIADRIKPIELDWNENWEERDLPICDIAISSRSFMGINPVEGITKLESVAGKSVCLGLWTHGEFDYDPIIANAIDYEGANPGVFTCILNLLIEMRKYPELRYIVSSFRPHKYESIDACIEETRAGFPNPLTPRQETLLREYATKHLVEYSDDKGSGLIFDHKGKARFAFIKWDVC